MKEKFDYFLKNDIPAYDAPYTAEQKYVILIMQEDNKISYGFGNDDYNFLITFPKKNMKHLTPYEVLEEELKISNSNQGIIYENIDGKGNFQSIAFIDKEHQKK